jgi:hypothetical protein
VRARIVFLPGAQAPGFFTGEVSALESRVVRRSSAFTGIFCLRTLFGSGSLLAMESYDEG